MDQHSPATFDNASAPLHALVDGRLPPADAAELRERLKEDPETRKTVDLWELQRTQLQALHRDLLEAAVPDALLKAALNAADRKDQQSRWWRWGGLAASVTLAFTLGWMGRGQWPPAHPPGDQASAARAQRFAQQAAVAHAVYQPEVRHPVEVTGAQQDHLVQWLSRRLGRPLKVPTLAAQGYELMGGRLLPGDSGARAQFMFQSGTGQRITLYLGTLGAPSSALPPASAASRGSGTPVHAPLPSAPETTFQFATEGPVPAFYWVDAGFGYALSGQLSRQELLALATAVYAQLQP